MKQPFPITFEEWDIVKFLKSDRTIEDSKLDVKGVPKATNK